MIHQSKKDLWLVSLVGLSALAPLLIGGYLIISDLASELGWALLSSGLVEGIIIWLCAYPTRYEINTSELVIQSGRSHRRIPIGWIENIEPARTWLSSPAWSLDRLQVRYRGESGSDEIFISPKDKESFLADLTAAAPGLRRTGDRVSRA